MINNIWFKIIAGKINKIPEFYTILARKIPNYIIRRDPRPGQGQNLEAEAKASRPRPQFWPRGLNITGLKCLIMTKVSAQALQMLRWKSREGTSEEESLEATSENRHGACIRDMLGQIVCNFLPVQGTFEDYYYSKIFYKEKAIGCPCNFSNSLRQHLGSGTVCHLTQDNPTCPMVCLGGHLRHFFWGSRATVYCDLC